MTKYEKPSKLSKRQLNLQRVNTYTSIHDLNCECQKPLQHIILQILQQEPSLKQDKEFVKEIQRCLSITAAGDQDGGVPEDGFGDGDLEKLFEAPFDDEDTG